MHILGSSGVLVLNFLAGGSTRGETHSRSLHLTGCTFNMVVGSPLTKLRLTAVLFTWCLHCAFWGWVTAGPSKVATAERAEVMANASCPSVKLTCCWGWSQGMLEDRTGLPFCSASIAATFGSNISPLLLSLLVMVPTGENVLIIVSEYSWSGITSSSMLWLAGLGISTGHSLVSCSRVEPMMAGGVIAAMLSLTQFCENGSVCWVNSTRLTR